MAGHTTRHRGSADGEKMIGVAAHEQQVVNRAIATFRHQYGDHPTHLAIAPGRVNLIGEHIDYSGGMVLPVAIQRVCVAAARLRPGAQFSRFFSADTNSGTSIDASARLVPQGSLGMVDGEIEVPRGKWWTYALGVVAQFQAKVGTPAVDVAFASSVPLGGGLSSSAALEVSLATLLAEFTRQDLTPRDRARWCQKADHQFVGVPCGIMDQYVSSAAVAGHALLIDCSTNLARAVPMPSPDQAVLVVIDSGVKHSHAGGEYRERADACRDGWSRLGLESLGDLEAGMVEGVLARIEQMAEPARSYLHHAVTEQVRTLDAARALGAGDVAIVGELMNASHTSLARDYRVSCAELDAIVAICQSVPGCFGSRMTGGGFGGCAIALATPQAAARLMEAVGEQIRTPEGSRPAMFTTTATAGAHFIELQPN